MITELESVFSKYLLSGSVLSIIGGSALFVFKIKPITIFTATDIEKKLYSKERNTFIRIVEVSFQIIVTFIGLLWFMLLFLSWNHPILSQIIFFSALSILASISIFFLYKVFKPGVEEYISSLSKKGKSYFALLIMATLIISYLILPALLGWVAPLDSKALDEIKEYSKTNSLIIPLLIVGIMLFLFSVMYRKIFSDVIKFLDSYILKSFSRSLFIKEDNGELINWYIFHSTEENKVLLGNNKSYHNSTEYKFIDKNELMNKKINVLLDEEERNN
ncbi:hypothetical protein [Paenibacillus shenyangensis]|uniref:hypothetical protein n=1 Tax=Paenibacillus sp. A9 TaxID=1284352 RepID=UPI00035D51C2|nr:hypothetical protein [Paenibacillus sp. A9]